MKMKFQNISFQTPPHTCTHRTEAGHPAAGGYILRGVRPGI